MTEKARAMRGFACIALANPKTPENVGGALRAAGCYGVTQIGISGARGAAAFNRLLRHATNTQRTERHVPVLMLDDPLRYLPHGTQVVAVELVRGATSLPHFEHPERALYVFGPEDGALDRAILDRARHVVSVPTRHCMNLAACVNVVLYDRMAKGRSFGVAYPAADFSHLRRRAAP